MTAHMPIPDFHYDDIILQQRATAERRLWISVLKTAVDDLTNGQSRGILMWTRTPDFRAVCKAAGCRPEVTAEKIRELANGK